jgi:NAD+-dependent protein deacetylase sirtuin 5
MHPDSQLHLLHGSLFDVRCTSFYCNYAKKNDFSDPIAPALAIPKSGVQPLPSATDKTGAEATKSLYEAMDMKNKTAERTSDEVDIADENVPIPELHLQDLPHCPECHDGILRPGVVWFGEPLPEKTISAIDEWLSAGKVDLILVIGTSAKVYPAAGYVDRAREQGARVAVVNMDRADAPGGRRGLMKGDWFFEGDAGEIVPEILNPIVGEIKPLDSE